MHVSIMSFAIILKFPKSDTYSKHPDFTKFRSPALNRSLGFGNGCPTKVIIPTECPISATWCKVKIWVFGASAVWMPYRLMTLKDRWSWFHWALIDSDCYTQNILLVFHHRRKHETAVKDLNSSRMILLNESHKLRNCEQELYDQTVKADKFKYDSMRLKLSLEESKNKLQAGKRWFFSKTLSGKTLSEECDGIFG